MFSVIQHRGVPSSSAVRSVGGGWVHSSRGGGSMQPASCCGAVVLVYCCVTNTPKVSSLKTNITYSASKSAVWTGLVTAPGWLRSSWRTHVHSGLLSWPASWRWELVHPEVGVRRPGPSRGPSPGCRGSSQHSNWAPGANVPREPAEGVSPWPWSSRDGGSAIAPSTPRVGGAVGEHGPVHGGGCAGPTGRPRQMGGGGGLLMLSAAEAQVSSVGHGVVTIILLSLFVVSLVTRFPPKLDGFPGLQASIWDGTRVAVPGALPWVVLPPRGPRPPPPDPLEALRRVWASSVSLFAGEGLLPSCWPLFV